MPYVGAVLMLGEWVDFHWEVNGKMFDFSIPGGGFISFRDLVAILGIAVCIFRPKRSPLTAD